MSNCQLGGKQFAVSVADVLLYDTSCVGEQLILNGKTLINSSITQAIQENKVYGGKGSQTQTSINYQKEITVTIEDSVFSPVYLAIQNGTNLVTEEDNFYVQETVTFDATGLATLKATPVGVVQVADEAGTYISVPATGNDIVVPEMADKESTAVFAESGEYRKLVIGANSFPKTMKLVLNVDIYGDNGKEEEMQIIIPRFKPDGAMEISLTHDGVATSALAGSAFSDCNGDYAKILWKKLDQTVLPCYTHIIANVSSITFNATDTEQLIIKAVRGGIYGNQTLTTGLEFTSGDNLIATVDATGLVTGVAVGNTTITVTDLGANITLTIPVEVIV